MYPQNNLYHITPTDQPHRIPRIFLRDVDLDDYLQLQLLLRREQERRRLEKEYHAHIEEARRLELALRRLQYCHQESQQERMLAAKRAREEQQERKRLIAQAIAEEEYRHRVAAAIEQRQAEAEAPKNRCEDMEVQSRKEQEAYAISEYRRRQLEGLLRHVFGYQVEVDADEEDEEDNWRSSYYMPIESEENDEEEGKEEDEKEIPLEGTYSKMTSLKPEEIPSEPNSEPDELKEHVTILQELLRELLSGAADDEQPASSSHISDTRDKQSASSSPIPATRDKAATKIQSWYKNAHSSHNARQILHQLKALSVLESRLDAIRTQHQSRVLSQLLSFDGGDGRLMPEDQGSLTYEDEIMQVLFELDTIESFKSELVRERRKELVDKASDLMEEIDRYKQSEWKKVSERMEYQPALEPVRVTPTVPVVDKAAPVVLEEPVKPAQTSVPEESDVQLTVDESTNVASESATKSSVPNTGDVKIDSSPTEVPELLVPTKHHVTVVEVPDPQDGSEMDMK